MEDPFNESLLRKMESILTSAMTTPTTTPITTALTSLMDDPMLQNVTEMIADVVLSTLAPNTTRARRRGGPFRWNFDSLKLDFRFFIFRVFHWNSDSPKMNFSGSGADSLKCTLIEIVREPFYYQEMSLKLLCKPFYNLKMSFGGGGIWSPAIGELEINFCLIGISVK